MLRCDFEEASPHEEPDQFTRLARDHLLHLRSHKAKLSRIETDQDVPRSNFCRRPDAIGGGDKGLGGFNPNQFLGFQNRRTLVWWGPQHTAPSQEKHPSKLTTSLL